MGYALRKQAPVKAAEPNKRKSVYQWVIFISTIISKMTSQNNLTYALLFEQKN